MLKIRGYSLIETIPYSAKDRALAFWVRQVGRPNVRAFTYIGKRARRMVAIYVRSVRNPTCIDCGDFVPWEEAIQVRLNSKRAYVCQSCFRSHTYRNPMRKLDYRKKLLIGRIVEGAKRLDKSKRIPNWRRYLLDKKELEKFSIPELRQEDKELTAEIFAAEERNPTIFETLFGKTKGLYEQFHSNPPVTRRVKIRVPNKGEKLVAIGRLISVEYRPYGSSRRKKVHYTHAMGDTGSSMLPDKPILATGKSGKGLFVIEDKAKNLHFSNRGIIG